MIFEALRTLSLQIWIQIWAEVKKRKESESFSIALPVISLPLTTTSKSVVLLEEKKKW